jgi:SAM-dependent methyltransferase
MSSAKGSDPPAFQSRDPRSAAFWDERFLRGFTPWDEGATPGALVRWLAANAPMPGTRVLIPGAGSAHEVAAFAAAGCNPLALDISHAAVQRAKDALGRHSHLVELGDAFAYTPIEPFDWLYERAFLCALPPDVHEHWAAMARRVVKPGGLLMGFFFLRAQDGIKGPPFAISPAALDALLAPRFVRVHDEPYETRLNAFDGGVRWQIWHKIVP